MSRRALLSLVCGLMTLTACDSSVYIIPEGQHRSTSRASLFTREEMRFQATFDDSAIYTAVIPENQHDINKLYGFSDCGRHHHHDSARFGWRWFNDQLEIMAYTYVDSARFSQSVGTVPLDTPSDYSIRIDGDSYIFTLNGSSIVMNRGCSSTSSVNYRSWPYFGGDEVAPHDITIIVDEEDY